MKELVLNDQGGSRMDITHGVTCTLRAEAHHPPVVLDEAAVFENHSQDTRYTGPIDTAPTVAATYGTGGNNQPFVVREESAVVFGICSKDSNAMKSCNPHSGFMKPGRHEPLTQTVVIRPVIRAVWRSWRLILCRGP